jgi:hypothetical protein
MTKTPEPPGGDPIADTQAMELDHKIEALLDELVASPEPSPLPADFSSLLLSSRPFAPWEVRHARFWKLPAAIGLGLIGASAGLFVAPLWRLGPKTALELWAKLAAAALASPLEAALAAGPLLVEALPKVSSAAAPAPMLLGLGAALAGAALVYGIVRPVRESGRAHASCSLSS